jgi:NADH dehydrogenase FAD-containing subunit
MSRERTQMTEEKLIPSVVVVGGGYAGIAVAKALDERTKVTLVEPRDAFVHNVAALRAAVDPTLCAADLLAVRPAACPRRGRP